MIVANDSKIIVAGVELIAALRQKRKLAGHRLYLQPFSPRRPDALLTGCTASIKGYVGLLL